jgi:hypothetical protein
MQTKSTYALTIAADPVATRAAPPLAGEKRQCPLGTLHERPDAVSATES